MRYRRHHAKRRSLLLVAGARRLPAPARVAARAARGGRLHRRRRVHRPVDGVLPRGAPPGRADRGARGGVRRVRRLRPQRRLGDVGTARIACRLRPRTRAGRPASGRWRQSCGRPSTRSGGSARPSRSTATSSTAAGCPSRRRRRSSPGCAPASRDLREWGDGDDVYQFLSRDETSARINVAGALGRAVRAGQRAGAAGRAGGWARRGGGAARRRHLRGDAGDGDPARRLGRCRRWRRGRADDVRRRAGPVGAALHRGLHRQAARGTARAAADEQLTWW